MNGASQDQAIEMLVARATEGLDEVQGAELDALLERHPELDDDSFELAAAAIDLAYTLPDQKLPAALRERVAAQAADFFEQQRPSSETAEVVSFPSRRAEGTGADPGRWLGWLAAAACLALAILGWWPERTATAPPQVIAAPRVTTAEQARDELIARAGDLLQLEWAATEDPAARGAGGDVVWSTESQRGFMRFRGLPVNDPSLEQYQLWIFDAEGDERFPVDGGVFDVTEPGEVVVEIDAKLRVARPTLFAVTIEKPGGVVVSSRERLPLLAEVS